MDTVNENAGPPTGPMKELVRRPVYLRYDHGVLYAVFIFDASNTTALVTWNGTTNDVMTRGRIREMLGV